MSADLPGSPASTGLADRAKAIVMQPKAEWPRIAAETTEPTQVLTGYVLPLALIGPVATLIGSQVFGSIKAVAITAGTLVSPNA